MSNQPTQPDPKLAHYLSHVLRLPDGHPLWLRDDTGRRRAATWRGGLITPDGDALPASPSDGPALWLAPALIKGHRLDWLLEKATELGAERVGFTTTARAVVRWTEDDFLRKRPRLEQQLEAAATQSGAPLPSLDAPAPLTARAQAWAAQGAALLVADLGAQTSVLQATQAATAQGATSVALFCGPEGGFTNTETQALLAAGAHPVSLGPHTLRAETAAIAMLAALRLHKF